MAVSKEIIKGEKPSWLGLAKPFISIFVAELIGTMILVFVGCGCVIDYDGDPLIPHHVKSLGFGFAVHLCIQMIGHLTACHINPAVSIVSLLHGFINIFQMVTYIMAQFVGAVVGFGLLKLLFPETYTSNGFCMTTVGGGATLAQGFFIELLITCVLCFVVCAIWDARNSTNLDSIPIRFGIIVGVISIVAGPFTGASMNTARSFGPAIFATNMDWSDQWIYWVAPNISPFISVGIYKLFFSEPKERISISQTDDDGRDPS